MAIAKTTNPNNASPTPMIHASRVAERKASSESGGKAIVPAPTGYRGSSP